jgi:SAM-dependent methyltransferase
MNTRDSFDKWASHYAEAAKTGEEPLWPSETLVRLFKGSYVPGLDRHGYRGKSVLEVGHGNGNNLVFLGSLGLRLAGTEVDERVCAETTRRLAELGLEADLKVGTNQALPWPDGSFDYLVSWNVIHYESTEKDLQKAIQEYRRVLKPGGRFFLSTTGPEHMILEGASLVGPHRYKIGRNDDFRKGEVFFYFDSPGYVHYYFDPHFQDVLVGRTHDHMMTNTLDWFIVTGKRSAA